MKRFQLITEADARVLEEGSTVELAPGGHVTPLAADTLRARRIVVARADLADADSGRLVPPTPVQKVAIGSDHSGFALKRTLVAELRGRGLQVIDVGVDTPDPADYPDPAARVARAVARREVEAGIAIDGAGLGSSIAANKIPGVRAAMCTNATLARYAREHSGANVLTLGASLVTPAEASTIVTTFLTTPMTEPRYIRRLAKIQRLDESRS